MAAATIRGAARRVAAVQTSARATLSTAPSRRTENADDVAAVRASARAFAQRELPDLAVALEAGTHPAVPPDWLRRYADAGFLGINLPTAYGGLGLPLRAAIAVLEEFAKISSAVAFPVFESTVGPVQIVLRNAQEPLKAAVVQRVCRGDAVVGIAMSEPGAGSALTDLTTRAVVDGDRIVLNGQKRWTSGGGHSDMVVFARLSDAPGAAGIGAVYVPCTTPGVHFGAPERLMGFRGVPSADVFLDDVVVPANHLLAAPPHGFRDLMAIFCVERLGNTTMAFAQAQAALDDALAYVQTRQQFGRPLVDFQAVQLKLADMALKVDTARLLLDRAVAEADAAENGLPSMLSSSMAKCYANEIGVEVVSMAMQLLGGYGYSTSFPMERRMRDVLGWRVAGGTVDMQKINIASALVGRRFNQRAASSQ